jgi:predicted oxidoreductase
MKILLVYSCSFDNAEVYADGKAEEVMGAAIKVNDVAGHVLSFRQRHNQ